MFTSAIIAIVILGVGFLIFLGDYLPKYTAHLTTIKPNEFKKEKEILINKIDSNIKNFNLEIKTKDIEINFLKDKIVFLEEQIKELRAQNKREFI